MFPTNLPHFLLMVLFLAYGPTTIAADLSLGQHKANTCATCHGPDGNSRSSAYPTLAGQKAAYLLKQLNNFDQGLRSNALMQNIAAGLSKADKQNLAAYFATVKPRSAGGNAKLAIAGQSRFSMCTGCHGSKAEGRSTFPRLAGQYPDYITQQLKAFQQGTRRNSTMQAIAASLTESDIQQISAYLGTLN